MASVYRRDRTRTDKEDIKYVSTGACMFVVLSNRWKWRCCTRLRRKRYCSVGLYCNWCLNKWSTYHTTFYSTFVSFFFSPLLFTSWLVIMLQPSYATTKSYGAKTSSVIHFNIVWWFPSENVFHNVSIWSMDFSLAFLWMLLVPFVLFDMFVYLHICLWSTACIPTLKAIQNNISAGVKARIIQNTTNKKMSDFALTILTHNR